jgi:hypothetical protein
MENFNGCYFKMIYVAFGKWILGYPARNLRLFKMNTGKFTNKMVRVILWGYKYGFRGFLLSALGAYDYFLSYAKLREKRRKKSE